MPQPTDPDATLDLIRSLRAVRRYASRPIEPAAMDRILDAARWTGSAKNRQPWSVILVEDRAALETLATCGAYASHLAGAAAAIVLVMDPASVLAGFDAGRLSQNIMLAAWAQGIGSCIASIFPEENLRRARTLLGVPDDRDVSVIIALGYPEDEAATRLDRSPDHVRAEVRPGRLDPGRFVHRERYSG
jgi:nitroreductase